MIAPRPMLARLWPSSLPLRKRAGVAISLALLVAVVVTFLTGFVAAALDLNRFAYHKYAAYAAIALAAAHVVLHWRVLVGQVRRWLIGRPAPAPAGTAPLAAAADGRVSRRWLLGPGLSLAAGLGIGRLSANAAAPLAGLEPGEDLGLLYHRWSTPTYAGLLSKSLHARVQPPVYKEYPGAPTIMLPPPGEPSGPSLEAVLRRRRSVRDFAERPMTLAELSRLLHDCAGVTDRRDPTLAFRSVPSSGALFPIELYPVVFNVAGVPPGAYHYGVERHQLELVRPGDHRDALFRAAVSQEMVPRASLIVVLTGLYGRVAWKYLDRSYRYIMLEAGHLGQNVYLAATALGLGPCGIGAFFDNDVDRLLGVDGREETTVYLLAVGTVAAPIFAPVRTASG